jgi:hypothetical protein
MNLSIIWLLFSINFIPISCSEVFKIFLSKIKIIIVENIISRLKSKLICTTLYRFLICITEISIKFFTFFIVRINWISSSFRNRRFAIFTFLFNTFIIVWQLRLPWLRWFVKWNSWMSFIVAIVHWIAIPTSIHIDNHSSAILFLVIRCNGRVWIFVW